MASSSATAGEEILYQPTPDWVDVAKLDSADGAGGTPLRLLEQQVRLEDGTVWTYIDNAVALESPEALTALGTLSAQWFPDKGNLIIHRVELMRDGQVIDVLAGEARFEAIRRERGLENRMLDGELTATMPLPGAQIGDIMRMSYSTTLSDQALGDHMQWTGVIITEPMPLAEGRIIASWPVESEVSSQVIAQSDMGMLEEKDGYRVYSVELPAAEPKGMPGDAPQRFRLPPMVQFSSYDSWEQLSREMEPLFATDGGLDSIPELVAKVSEITSRTDDSLERAALATQLVQDEISYLLNGLNGGNYIPQTIGETWDKRYGDCKAKTLLLLTMLRKMDIEANALLVQTVYGDALPQILPMPGNFDHLIVHARIGGEDYWLDGTGSGTRLDNIADVPRFFYGLPLKPEGANLVEMVARPLAVPAETIRLTIDQSAGIAVPALFDIEVDLTGASAAAWKAISQMEEAEVRDNMIDRVARNVVGSSQVTERAVSFDDEAGTARINLSGLRTTPWRQNRGIYENNINFQLANGFSVDVDRARKEWREIPVVINAPIYEVREIVWSLPDEEFTLEGSPSINQMIAGNTINSEVRLDIGRLYLDQSMRSHVWELEAAELPAAKRETARLKRALPTLKASRDARRSWEYRGKHRKLLEKLEDAYAKLIEDADDDDASAHANRAGFRAGTGDFQGALEDLNEAIARAASTGLYYRRASAHQQLGDLENALSDLETAEELQGNGASHGSRIEILGLLRRGDEALALAEEFALIADDFEQGEQVRAFALGWAGQAAEGLTVLRDIADTSPEDANQLNEACWYAGIWNMVDEDILAICTAAVERGGVSAPARDSRALALYRLGRSEEAVTELDEVLSAHPDQHASRYLRGIIRTQLGDEGGRDDINSALWAAPSMKRTYTAYGLGPA
ncbi:DUF3857 domain-containing protein [Altererythrobacter sp. MF3-039]|uniref:DUF3857 domain-containing protein n=1 Tax=Altererythrobacter sp. MF3-039 TaxID=3252901 RepID=UPI00390C65EF